MTRISGWLSLLLVSAAFGTVGCGGAETTTDSSATPAVDLGAPADEPAPTSDADAPVLPIPDDAPAGSEAPAETPIKPIPDDAPAEGPKLDGNTEPGQ